jgi:hypothetical protein
MSKSRREHWNLAMKIKKDNVRKIPYPIVERAYKLAYSRGPLLDDAEVLNIKLRELNIISYNEFLLQFNENEECFEFSTWPDTTLKELLKFYWYKFRIYLGNRIYP